MKDYAVCSMKATISKGVGEGLIIVVSLPDNATPIQFEYRPPQRADTLPDAYIHYLIPCDEKGLALCEICNTQTANYDGKICQSCYDKLTLANAFNDEDNTQDEDKREEDTASEKS
ncbi:MAG: hypothetical protein PHZ19_08895 [Candidatus Thermoplasmatota archaeon]|nr:hypothetical protein [Candidatus Thermoplasmatota archaeon]